MLQPLFFASRCFYIKSKLRVYIGQYWSCPFMANYTGQGMYCKLSSRIPHVRGLGMVKVYHKSWRWCGDPWLWWSHHWSGWPSHCPVITPWGVAPFPETWVDNDDDTWTKTWSMNCGSIGTIAFHRYSTIVLGLHMCTISWGLSSHTDHCTPFVSNEGLTSSVVRTLQRLMWGHLRNSSRPRQTFWCSDLKTSSPQRSLELFWAWVGSYL